MCSVQMQAPPPPPNILHLCLVELHGCRSLGYGGLSLTLPLWHNSSQCKMSRYGCVPIKLFTRSSRGQDSAHGHGLRTPGFAAGPHYTTLNFRPFRPKMGWTTEKRLSLEKQQERVIFTRCCALNRLKLSWASLWEEHGIQSEGERIGLFQTPYHLLSWLW